MVGRGVSLYVWLTGIDGLSQYSGQFVSGLAEMSSFAILLKDADLRCGALHRRCHQHQQRVVFLRQHSVHVGHPHSDSFLAFGGGVVGAHSVEHLIGQRRLAHWFGHVLVGINHLINLCGL